MRFLSRFNKKYQLNTSKPKEVILDTFRRKIIAAGQESFWSRLGNTIDYRNITVVADVITISGINSMRQGFQEIGTTTIKLADQPKGTELSIELVPDTELLQILFVCILFFLIVFTAFFKWLSLFNGTVFAAGCIFTFIVFPLFAFLRVKFNSYKLKGYLEDVLSDVDITEKMIRQSP